MSTEPGAGLAAARTASPGAWMGAMGASTRLLLVRHGQTEFSAQRRYAGRANPELTTIGRHQADAIARRLAGVPDIAAVVSSPLRRARQTADAVATATGVPVENMADLTETDFGAWDGLTFTEAAQQDPEVHRAWLSDPAVATPGGESIDNVSDRVARVLERIVANHGGRTVVIVSHVTPIKTLLRIALGTGSDVLYRFHLDLASLSIAEFYPDGHSSVLLVNDTGHLAAG